MDGKTTHSYEFGPFRVDTANHLLLRDGRVVPLKPKVFDALVALVENRGRVLAKDELMEMLWPDSFVEESNLTQTVYMLRKALGEGPNDHNYVETIPKRGYRFLAVVRQSREGIDLGTKEELGATVERDERVDPELAENESPAKNRKKPNLQILIACVTVAAIAVVGYYLGIKPTRLPASTDSSSDQIHRSIAIQIRGGQRSRRVT